MNDFDADWLLPPTHGALIYDMEIERQGQFSKRRGAASIGASSGISDVKPGGAFPFYDDALGQGVLLGIQDGMAQIFQGNGAFFQVASGASFARTLHMGSRGYAGGRDTIYVHSAEKNFSNPSLASCLVGIDIDRNASTVTDMKPTCSTWWQYRLWVGNNLVTPNDQTVWWSELNNGLAYSAVNSIQVEPGRGGRVMAFAPIRSTQEVAPQMLIFKERLIAILTTYWGSSGSLIPAAADALDTVNSSVKPISDSYGCVATKSLQYVTGSPFGDLVFLAHDGIRAIRRAQNDTLAGASKPISEPIRSTIGRINFTHAHKAASVVWDQKYFLAVPLDGARENSHVIILDLNTGAWYINRWSARDLAADRLTETDDKLYFQNHNITTDSTASGQAAGYHIFKGYTGNFDPDSKAVRYQWDTRGFAFQDISRKKAWDYVGLMGEMVDGSSPVEVWARVDHGGWSKLAVDLEYPDPGAFAITLGEDALPWTKGDSQIYLRQADLSLLKPGYVLQLRVMDSGVSNSSRPTFYRMNVTARMIDAEFDAR
jgi:hypothetical protein